MATLTVAALRAAKPRDAIWELKDDGLTGGYVQVWPSGSLSYLLRYRFKGANRKLTIGRFDADAGGLARVRKAAREALNLRHEGVDPSARKQEAKAAERAALQATKTKRGEALEVAPDQVEKVVNEFLEHHVRHLRDHAEMTRVLKKEILGRWRDRRLSEITSAEVRAMHREVGERAPVGANRALSKFKRLCNWAIEQEIIATSPADKVRAAAHAEQTRERALDDRELALVWKAAERVGGAYSGIIQVLILTGQRRGEVAGMTWDEVDLARGVWTIPAARSKNGNAHIVALTDPVLAILNALPRFARAKDAPDCVWGMRPIARGGMAARKQRLDEALLAIMREQDPKAGPMPDFVVHDLRRSVATGMQRLGVQLPIIEKCLNHVGGSFSGIVGVYQRHAFADETRDAFTRWAAHVEGLVGGDSGAGRNVIALAARGK